LSPNIPEVTELLMRPRILGKLGDEVEMGVVRLAEVRAVNVEVVLKLVLHKFLILGKLADVASGILV